MPTSRANNFFLNFDSWDEDFLFRFFQRVRHIKANPSKISLNKTAVLMFFEPSTRTRMSYELAAFQEGYYPSLFLGKESTSLNKGESFEDTFENIHALNPDIIIVRAPDSFPFSSLSSQAKVPVLNAGWGQIAHPSQALLDLFTLTEKFQNIKGLQLLVVGDLKHSRVFRSLSELAQLLKVELAVAAPENFQVEGFRSFQSLEEGLKWADVAYFLRLQKERHVDSKADSTDFSNFCWDQLSHQFFIQKGGLIMHPGPVNYGFELSYEVGRHPQSLILAQVANGIYVRRALLRLTSEGVI